MHHKFPDLAHPLFALCEREKATLSRFNWAALAVLAWKLKEVHAATHPAAKLAAPGKEAISSNS